MPPLLKIEKLCTWFEQESSSQHSNFNQILFDVSLTLDGAKTAALVGESGSGKTVTALSVLRLLEEVSSVKQSGSIELNGRNIFNLNTEEIRTLRGNAVAMIFQEPMTSLNPVYTIGNQLIEPLLLHRGMSKKQAMKEAADLLSRTGIENPDDRLNSFPHQLSGGQRQRVMIAMAIACRPKLLIADEPTTALDVTVQAQILDLLQSLQNEFNMAILLITHNLPMVKKLADTVYIMKSGRIVESGSCRNIFSSATHDYTRKLLGAIPAAKAEPKPLTSPLLTATNLNCRFTLKRSTTSFFSRSKKIITAVDNVNVSIAKGTTCGIVGESGSGKTTLALALLRLVRSSGEIHFNGHRLDALSGKEIRPLRREMQLVFQDPYSSLSPRLSIEEIVAEGLKVHSPGISGTARKTAVMAALEEVGLEAEMARRYPHEFSGGQRQRIAIARAIILQPKLLVLDEPTSALDMTIQAQIIKLLLGLQKKHNLTYLFISHDLRVIRALADHVIVMRHGTIVESGPAEELFTTPRQDYTRKLFNAALS
ncbi:MAG: dipeptide ABC transporter ATP-binding protein [Desulfopila sp.]|jgi:microcin C transport system ATP-binding protein|nr:dipeptide ABC transporter ATP-binding protein [Desulfopila sp.]